MVKFKLLLDKDDEVKWLNEMANNGYAFKKFRLGFYFFEECEPSQYIYDIDLLSKVSQFGEFKTFMNEADVEVLSRWYKWVYVRKVNDSKGFELYSDVESKIEHYSRILKLFRFAFILELICLFVEIYIPYIERDMRFINLVFIAIILFCAICIFGGYSKTVEKIKFYKQQTQ